MKAEDKRACPVCGTLLADNSESCPVCVLQAALKPETGSLSDTSSELRFEHFQVLKNVDGTPIELGHGGMGITYKAFDTHLRCPVALKIINARLIGDAAAQDRFVREARAAASVHHSNVASVSYLGESGGNYFYAMEFVEGETLETLIRRSGTLKTDLTLEIVTQVAAGLAAIHKQHLVYRDIKPSNIMVSLEDGRLENVKIIDLGLAKVVAEGGTISAAGSFIGTPAYASPEQFAGIGTDIRSDLYSLGITLWEMLSGKLPFEGSAADLMDQHQHAALPTEKLRSVPAPVIALLQVLLAKDPNQRFQGPAQLQRALVRVKEALASGSRPSASELRTIGEQRTAQSPKRTRKTRVARWLIASTVSATALLLGWFFFVANRGPFFNWRSADSTATERSIAVLPFENISSNRDDAYFADGVQDEILNNLAKVAQLKVISRTSVMQYRAEAKRDLRQIANALGVVNVLEGTVRREGNWVRVSTELIDARNDQTIWADSYDRDLSDIFAIQSDVAQTIAAKLAATLSPAEKRTIEKKPTDNLEAYDLYLRAKESMDFSGPLAAREGLLRAVGMLEQAVRLDPNFVMAYCASADVHDILYSRYDQTPERLALADGALNVALRLQPDLPEVHLAMARHFYLGYRNYDGARVQLAIAKRGLPNNVEATRREASIDLKQGNRDKAIDGAKEALTLDPLNVSSLDFLGQLLCMKRRFDEAVPFFDRMIRLKPDVPMLKVNKVIFTRFLKTGDTGPVWSAIAALPQSADEDPDLLDTRVWLALVEHDWPQAEQLIEKMKSRHIDTNNVPGIRLAPAEWNSVLLARLRKEPTTNPAFAEVREQLNVKVLKAPQDAELLSILAVLDALLDRKEIAISEAKRAVEMLPVSKDAFVGSVILMNLAIVYTWTGELDLAFNTLEPLTKRQYGSPYYGELKREPWWEPLRQDPRYNKLLAELASKD